ncbi:MAG: maleylpyruvate isomerase N-terminal domain-containing protein, partial [Acidimicrobiales bacterium]
MTLPAAATDAAWRRILGAYGDGVRAVQRLGLEYVDWSLATDWLGWAAIDLAGHVLATARSYHRLLDAALAGRPRTGLAPGDDLADCGAARPATLAVSGGADRIVAFDAVATRYGERVSDLDPDLVLGAWSGVGALTLRQHTMLAAGEWHLHAWDLAGALGWDYRPPDPDVLLEGRRLL